MVKGKKKGKNFKEVISQKQIMQVMAIGKVTKRLTKCQMPRDSSKIMLEKELQQLILLL